MLPSRNSTQTLNYLASIHFATDLQDVGNLCRTLSIQCGLSGLMIQTVKVEGQRFINPSCRCFGSYVYFHPEYIEEELFAEDPLLMVGLELTVEFDWDRAYSMESHRAPTTALRWRLRHHGMNAGLSSVQYSVNQENTLLAVHLAVGDEQLSEEQTGVFENILPYLVRLSEREWMEDGPSASLRQLSIARHLKNGMSRRQTANKLNIPLRAVNFHINRLIESLSVSSIEEALDLLDFHCVF